MEPSTARPVSGQVASLHLHPEKPGTPMRNVASIEVVAGMGIQGNDRYFGRKDYTTGYPTMRQVSLIEREQIAEHALALKLAQIHPGAVRANIETVGIDLNAFLGKDVRVGEAVLRFCVPRTPCAKMDAICQGLRARMEGRRQGVLAQVIQSGRIVEGDPIISTAP